MWWLLFAGCPWVSQADLDEQLLEVDDDGDGVPNRLDCLPLDATAYPGAPETWYDGVDQDCAGGDDWDQDGDGHPAPEGGGDDCEDTSALIHPGASDPAYDGVDQDCAGDDDFDQDADGWVPDAYAGRPTEGVAGSGGLPAGDCDDLAAAVNPAAADAWYDGVDTDCGGEDDFDQDADGWVPLDVTYGPTTYVDGSGALPVGDCDDLAPDVNPDATERWYDGVDQDCAGDDDSDQDADGFPLDADCDDTDATVSPDAVERLGDTTDQDCDGGGDSFPLRLLDGTWEGAIDPVFADDGSTLWLSVGVDHVLWDGDEAWDGGFALGWDLAALDADPPFAEAWSAAPSDTAYALSGVHAVRAGPSGELWGMVGITGGTTRSLRVVRWGSAGRPEGVIAQSTGATTPFEDGDLQVDDAGSAYAVACESGEGVLAYVRVDDPGGGYAAVNQEVTGAPTSTCALALGTAPAVVGSMYDQWVAATFDPAEDAPTFTPLSLGATLRFNDLDWVPTDPDERVLGMESPDGVLWTWSPVTGELASPAGALGFMLDAVLDPTGSWWTVRTNGSVTSFGYGSALDALRGASLTVEVTPADVAVWSDAGWVYVAAVGPEGVAVGRAMTP